MLRPSYGELMRILNEDPNLDTKVTSRYAIVIAAAKRARQIIDGAIPQAEGSSDKALSIALNEMSNRLIKIIPSGDSKAESGFAYRTGEYRPTSLTPDEAAYKAYVDDEEEDEDYGDGDDYDAAGFTLDERREKGFEKDFSEDLDFTRSSDVIDFDDDLDLDLEIDLDEELDPELDKELDRELGKELDRDLLGGAAGQEFGVPDDEDLDDELAGVDDVFDGDDDESGDEENDGNEDDPYNDKSDENKK